MANSVTGSVWRQGIPMAGWNGNQALTVGRSFLQGRNGGFSGEGKRRTEGGLSWAPGYGSERAHIAGVQSLCPLFATPWTATCQAPLSFTISQSLLKLKSVMPSNHLTLCRPLLLLPSIFPSIRVFSNESALCIRWPKYRSFSFSISPSMNIQDWFPLGWTGWISLQSKELSKSLHQHHSSKASILRGSAFFTVQLSHPYMTPGKTIVLTIQTFVRKVMSLLFNMLSEFVIAFLPRSYCLLTSE